MRSAKLLNLPILATQMGPGNAHPFPHVVLSVQTSALSDDDCTLCCWNIAVSRPQTHTVRGGNWARGTAPERIREIWDEFRAETPVPARTRGTWMAPFSVPVIPPGRFLEFKTAVRSAPNQTPELLLPSPFTPANETSLLVFSDWDIRSLELLGEPPTGLKLERRHFPGYSDISGDPAADVRAQIEHYFRTEGLSPPSLDFDTRR